MASRTETIAPIALSVADVVASTGVGRTKIYSAIATKSAGSGRVDARSTARGLGKQARCPLTAPGSPLGAFERLAPRNPAHEPPQPRLAPKRTG
jgi:hypothetical protein